MSGRRVAGVDVGSRSIEVVVITGNGDIDYAVEEETSYDPLGQCRRLLAPLNLDHAVATGYGRHLLARHLKMAVVTEIKAHATAAGRLYPNCRAVLDIGGQDTKAIALDLAGKVTRFEMNDRCAAGTGRFLEIMAATLGLELHELAEQAQKAPSGATISSMCTVFATSEVTGLVSAGQTRDVVARGILESVAARAAAMLRRLPAEPDVVFSGGVAKNQCLRELLESELNLPVRVPERPQFIGALGAALLARHLGGAAAER
ncbi:MAG: acyl-CoA dehydratase activase [Pseudomonadota bacterium]